MGVRGLTTYIERNKDKYLKNYYLRDTHLVIDGNSLCAQLYIYYAKCNDEFGGDYDKFARCIETFFSLLKQCNVSPIVIMDGGYERKKIKTVNFRLQSKLKLIQNMNPAINGNATIFPLFYREAFKDVVIKLKVPLVRCDFEADFEIACVARKLKCPVLSYDSDFFIFDTLYIPFNSIDFYVTKIDNNKGSNKCICCKIYNIEVFLKSCKIDKSLLPLLATLLGNDYIKKTVFTKFYNHIKLPKKNNSRSEQHRTIIALLKWMQNQNYETAVRKILSRLKKHERYNMAQKIKKVAQGYICTYSELFDYLGLNKDEEMDENVMEIDMEEITSDEEESSNSNESKSDDESEIDVDLSIDDNVQIEETFQSQWFKNNIRNGNFPTLFIDILSLNMGFYQPQIEDTTNIESFNIFIPILKAIAKILLEGDQDTFSFLGRNENARPTRYRYKVSQFNLPKLSEIENLSAQKCRNTFLGILKLNKEDCKKIQQFPEQWQLYLLSLVYWIRNAVDPQVSYCHLCSIILCLLHLNVVDKKVSNIRDKNHFTKKYDKKLKDILISRKQAKEETNADKTNETKVDVNNLTIAIDDIDGDDCLFFIDSLVSNFTIHEKVKFNKNLFYIHIIDAFAQFQSCLLHIKYLNALLKFPFSSFDICSLFNGTYIYNIYLNLDKRNDINAYIELILKNSPSLLQIFKQIITILNTLVSVNIVTRSNKKRKRKRKKTVTEQDDVIEVQSDNQVSQSDEEILYDENNKFSILALTD